jgi:AcrR family transcriptional regulator
MARRREAREDQLLETATRLFKEKGYHNTSMQDLADALGLQKGSLYHYIDSKQELLRRLLERATSFLAISTRSMTPTAPRLRSCDAPWRTTPWP